ncbi:hypothetical protein [Nitrosopumilus sp.]|uniref:hypothetical protein n=1 Tax=Nitrosopumilus sp. TaxID=2024843 RepID=UPI00292E6C85|nr:hypothetical protein [Nitrosopumilus sp.]
MTEIKQQLKLGSYVSVGDSTQLSQIDGKPFTITAIEDSDYTDGDSTTPGVKITTKEEFDINGEKYNKFHTTRSVIVENLRNEKLRTDIQQGNVLGPLVCKKNPGKKYYVMEDVNSS